MNIPKQQCSLPWRTPFFKGLFLHTLLVVVIFGVIFVSKLFTHPGDEISLVDLYAWLPILFLDFPIAAILEHSNIGLFEGFLLFASLGGAMWGAVFAIVARLVRIFRSRKPSK